MEHTRIIPKMIEIENSGFAMWELIPVFGGICLKYSNTYLEIEKHIDIGKELKVWGFQCNTSCKQESNIMNRDYNVYQTSILYVSIVGRYIQY